MYHRGDLMSIYVVAELLGLDASSLAVGIDFSGELIVDGLFRGGEGGLSLGTEGGGSCQSFLLDLTAVNEKTFFEMFLSVLVDGVLADGTSNNAVGMFAEVSVEGGDPVGKVRI